MATTPNYGWVMPDPTDFVTDLPADFEIFGDAVDADLAGLLGGTTGQVLVKNSGTDHDYDFGTDPVSDIVTTAGDVLYGSAADTLARLGIGTAGQVLAVNGTADAPEWITSTAPASNFTLVNAGGTALTGGVSTVTISGISGANQLMFLFEGVSMVSGSSVYLVRFNSDTTANYALYGLRNIANAAYSAAVFDNTSTGTQTSAIIGNASSNANSTMNGYIKMSGANSSGIKVFDYGTGSTNSTGNGQINHSGGGVYLGTSTISSITFTGNSNFDAGIIYIYASA